MLRRRRKRATLACNLVLVTLLAVAALAVGVEAQAAGGAVDKKEDGNIKWTEVSNSDLDPEVPPCGSDCDEVAATTTPGGAQQQQQLPMVDISTSQAGPLDQSREAQESKLRHHAKHHVHNLVHQMREEHAARVASKCGSAPCHGNSVEPPQGPALLLETLARRHGINPTPEGYSLTHGPLSAPANPQLYSESPVMYQADPTEGIVQPISAPGMPALTPNGPPQLNNPNFPVDQTAATTGTTPKKNDVGYVMNAALPDPTLYAK